MKELFDTLRIRAVFEQLQGHFSRTPNVLRLYEFEKGELLNDPDKPLEQFLIIVEGSVFIYDLTESGLIRYISKSGHGALLGDIEFSRTNSRGFFTEAAERVVCLAIPFSENCDLLENDPLFLRFIISELARKLSLSTEVEITTQTLEEKLMLYLNRLQPTHEITSVNEALKQLHCSRRQLQRVLSKLCDEGTIVKCGKGWYKLAIDDK